MIDRTFLHTYYFISNDMIFRAQFGMMEHLQNFQRRKRTHTLIVKSRAWISRCCGLALAVVLLCSEILAHIKLLYNPRVDKVFTSLHTLQRPKVALALRARTILLVFEILLVLIYSKLHSELSAFLYSLLCFFSQLVEYSVSTGFVASRLIGWIEFLQISWFSIKNDRSRPIRRLSGYGSHSSHKLIDRIADQYLSASAGRVLFIQPI